MWGDGEADAQTCMTHSHCLVLPLLLVPGKPIQTSSTRQLASCADNNYSLAMALMLLCTGRVRVVQRGLDGGMRNANHYKPNVARPMFEDRVVPEAIFGRAGLWRCCKWAAEINSALLTGMQLRLPLQTIHMNSIPPRLCGKQTARVNSANCRFTTLSISNGYGFQVFAGTRSGLAELHLSNSKELLDGLADTVAQVLAAGHLAGWQCRRGGCRRRAVVCLDRGSG